MPGWGSIGRSGRLGDPLFKPNPLTDKHGHGGALAITGSVSAANKMGVNSLAREVGDFFNIMKLYNFY